MTTLTKKEFLKLVAEQLETSVTKTEATLDGVWKALEIALIDEQSGVKLGGIGTVSVEVAPERTHRNPQNGEEVVKPEHYKLKFKANAAFKRDLAEVEISK